jgi:ribulose-5-phosphate 4-epimerase/fuculose-1-phosphate aldolase
VNAIFHGHSLPILNAAHSLKLVETKREKPFGSLDLIREVIKVLNDSNFIVMKNHGFLSLGENMDNAGKLAISIQKAAKKILLRNSRDMGATSEER